MGKLIYSAIESLDGYIADATGSFDWAMPDEEVHTFVNELERPATTYLLGRRMYEVMAVWDSLGSTGDEPPYIQEYARIWRAADKIVYSTTLVETTTERTELRSAFDPDDVRLMKSESEGDMSVGGAHLAAQAIAAGIVDELRLFVTPVVVGGGTRSLPSGIRLNLELADEHRFDNGMVYLRYRPAR